MMSISINICLPTVCIFFGGLLAVERLPGLSYLEYFKSIVNEVVHSSCVIFYVASAALQLY